MQKIVPNLWFSGRTEEAVEFYVSLFEESKIGTKSYYGKSMAQASGQPEGALLTIEFELAGQKFLALNGGPHFHFTPAVSLYVSCNDDQEIESLWKKLSKDGKVFWELKDYPWSSKYGWCQDQYGVPWQLILGKSPQRISPAFLFTGPLLGKGKEAMAYWIEQFPNSKTNQVNIDPKTGTITHANFFLDNQSFVIMEGDSAKEFEITGAISFVVECENQKEVDSYWEKFSKSGKPDQCGWVQDQFGVFWQVVPTLVEKVFAEGDPVKAEKLSQAILQMNKLEIKKIQQAISAR